MNTRRFLEVCSAYRDRNIYPNVGNFEIPFGNSYSYSNYNASKDTVTKGTINYTWQGGYGPTGHTGDYISSGILKTGTTDALLLLAQSSSNPVLGLNLGPTGPTIMSSAYNHYLGYGFYNETKNETRLITSYNPSSHGITLNSAIDGNAINDVYVIYDPSSSDNLQIHIPAIDSLGNTILTYAQAYNNYYIVDETLSLGTNIVARKIVSYDYQTQIATISSAFPGGWSSTDVYTLRYSLPNEKWAVTSVNNNNVTISSTNYLNNVYSNMFLYNSTVSGTGSSTTAITTAGSSLNQIYYINSYTGSSQTLSLSMLNNNLVLPAVGDIVNIVNFDRDNCVPLMYSGSLTSQEQSVCYEIGITDITIPNVILSTGSRVVNYPYIYVTLEAISSSSGGMNNNIFYSNNPNSKRAVFVVTNTDTTQPLISPFLKTDSGSMTVTMKFKPNDTFRFSITLPDGSPFVPFQSDNKSPFPCNPLLQVSCVFSIRRIAP